MQGTVRQLRPKIVVGKRMDFKMLLSYLTESLLPAVYNDKIEWLSLTHHPPHSPPTVLTFMCLCRAVHF